MKKQINNTIEVKTVQISIFQHVKDDCQLEELNSKRVECLERYPVSINKNSYQPAADKDSSYSFRHSTTIFKE